MTTFNFSTHRAVFAKDTQVGENEIIWWGDIEATMLRHLFGSTKVKIQLAEPEDTTVLHYKPHATNGGNGVFYLYYEGAWQVATPALIFIWMRQLAGLEEAPGLYVHPNHSGHVVSAGDGATTIQSDVVTNGMLANVPAYTFKLRNDESAGDPQDVNAKDLPLDSAPSATKVVMTFDPTTGQPRKSPVSSLGGQLLSPSGIGTLRLASNGGTGVQDAVGTYVGATALGDGSGSSPANRAVFAFLGITATLTTGTWLCFGYIGTASVDPDYRIGLYQRVA